MYNGSMSVCFENSSMVAYLYSSMYICSATLQEHDCVLSVMYCKCLCFHSMSTDLYIVCVAESCLHLLCRLMCRPS
jgi:hypothetical protein